MLILKLKSSKLKACNFFYHFDLKMTFMAVKKDNGTKFKFCAFFCNLKRLLIMLSSVGSKSWQKTWNWKCFHFLRLWRERRFPLLLQHLFSSLLSFHLPLFSLLCLFFWILHFISASLFLFYLTFIYLFIYLII